MTPQEKNKTIHYRYFINMGPQHPSTHGVLRLVLRTDGEIVSDRTEASGIAHLHNGGAR